MFSLPMIAPVPDARLWPSYNTTHTDFSDSSHSPPNTSHGHRRPTSHHGSHQNHNAFLAALTADENTITQRKLNVCRFGAGWLRPIGVSKTLQQIRDEELEKEEQELMQRREQAEVDLDDDVPEAQSNSSESESESESGSSSGEEEEGSEEGREESTVPFNEDSFIEGSMLEAEVSHMLEMEEAEMAGVLQDERDLDDDVPEAGSYEHTDSELEDSSDIDNSVLPPGLSSVRSRRSTRRRSSGRRSSGRRSSGLPHGMALGVQPAAGRISLGVDLGNGRSSFGIDGSSSMLEGSSFLRSSPQ
ncbi:Apc15p domain containing protein [Pyrenophora tritici-repentis]|uniref:Apc15p domain containing protein n=1 Tax=Pyrenophora tritici-repentis TaxID=45151 RepID=A0A834RY60_9PLEO|nr:Apc15p domain containing protein [Pyrenophora tritici-repentis]